MPDPIAPQAPDAPPPAADVPRGTEAAPSPAPVVEQPKEPKGVARRIDELTRNWREAERREEALRSVIDKLVTTKPAEVKQSETLADFGYDEKKYFEHLTGKAAKAAVEVARKEAESWRGEQERASRRKTFDERVEKFAATVEDFRDVFTDSTPVSQAMAEAMMDTDEGPAIAYYLGKNPDIALKLYNLSPVQAGRELARIEDKIVSERKKAQEKQVSQAPSPTPRIEGTDPGTSIKPDDPDSDSKLSDAEWARKRNKQVAKRSA